MDARIDRALPAAMSLVGAVHDWDAEAVERIVADPDVDVPALLTVLAAMVDPDRPPSELLAWVDNPTPWWLPIAHQNRRYLDLAIAAYGRHIRHQRPG